MTIEERLETLERGLSAAKRRTRYLLIGLIVLAVAWGASITTGTVKAQGDVEKVVRAEKFEMVDSEGKVQAVLGMSVKGPGLDLYDEKGTIRAGLWVAEFGSGLFLYSANGMARAKLAGYEDESLLGLFDTNGTIRSEMVVSKEFGPRLVLLDEWVGETEHPLWSAP